MTSLNPERCVSSGAGSTALNGEMHSSLAEESGDPIPSMSWG
jgi:hypothetical protein